MQLCEHQVRERAYFIWEGEGRVPGRADLHWYQAEAELKASASAAVSSPKMAVTPAAVTKPRPSRAKSSVTTAATTEKPVVKTRVKAVRKTTGAGAPLH